MAFGVRGAGEFEYGGGGDGDGDAVGDYGCADVVAGVFVAWILAGDWVGHSFHMLVHPDKSHSTPLRA